MKINERVKIKITESLTKSYLKKVTDTLQRIKIIISH
jgi:hypothetical protein